MASQTSTSTSVWVSPGPAANAKYPANARDKLIVDIFRNDRLRPILGSSSPQDLLAGTLHFLTNGGWDRQFPPSELSHR